MRRIAIVGGLVLLLIALKLPGLDLPLHQGEWKAAHFAVAGPAELGPYFQNSPLGEAIFSGVGAIIPPMLFRLLPLLFTLFSYILLYLIVEVRAGRRAALFALFLFGTVAYGALGAIMFDLDGAILPFFFLLSVYAYDRLQGEKSTLLYAALFLIAIVGGLFTRPSFLLAALAIAVDHVWRGKDGALRKLGWLSLSLLLLVGVGGLYLAGIFVPVFDVSRDWGQIAVQVGRVVLYFGPLLGALAFVNRAVFDRTRIFFLYLAAAFLHYIVLFDFSTGDLDKFLLLIVVPLSAIIGVTIEPYMPTWAHVRRGHWIAAALGIISLLSLNLLPQEVIPLYPKSAWFTEIMSFHWNILVPFMGGSGPVGFYVSFLFIIASYIVAAALILLAFLKPALRKFVIPALILLSILYAGVFTEEMFVGKINGSTKAVVQQSLAFIQNTNQVSSIITSNCTGCFDLWQMGKFSERFYGVPKYEQRYKDLFASYTGQYLVVDIPRWDSHSFYSEFFSNCTSMFTSVSGAITAHVYRCANNKAGF